MNDPCNNIDSLNFESEDDLKKILFRDKHTRIEGLFTEIFFYNEIIKGNFENVSSSWWFSLKDRTYNVSKIVCSLDELCAFDIKLMNFFIEKESKVYLIVFSEIDKKFFYIRYKNEYAIDIKQFFNKEKKEFPKNPQNAPIPEEKERIKSRIEQAISFLKSAGILKKCAIERMFANCWLGNGFFWDIDFFVEYKNNIVAFEVKEKYPTADNKWGLNVGLSNLFSHMNSMNIEVIHVILNKPVNDKNIPAIDLYTKEEYKKNAKWIATKFNKNFLKNKSIAPEYTSIFGRQKLSYYKLAPEIFTTIKEVTSTNNKILTYLDANS